MSALLMAPEKVPSRFALAEDVDVAASAPLWRRRMGVLRLHVIRSALRLRSRLT